MEWRKLFEMLFSRAPQYQPEPAKRDARTDKERYDDSLKKQGLYIPPKELAEEFYKKHPKPPKAAAEVEALMAEVRTDFSATPDKMIFFQKYTALFNCYAYASGGVGNPFVMDTYDKPKLTMGIPGALAGKAMRFVEEGELDRAVIADGYLPVIPREKAGTLSVEEKTHILDAAEKEIRPSQILVAALIDDRGAKREMHFLVRNQQGHWSQKFGSSEIHNKDYDGHYLRPPHLGTNYIQKMRDDEELGYRFVGYYWRPTAGIPVIGGIPAVIGIKAATGEYSHDVWLSANESDVHSAKEVRGWSVKKNADGSITLGLEHDHKQQTFVTLPRSSIITLNEPENGGKVDYISIIDPSGPAIQLKLLPNGKVKPATIDNPDIKRSSPFRE